MVSLLILSKYKNALQFLFLCKVLSCSSLRFGNNHELAVLKDKRKYLKEKRNCEEYIKCHI